jgi:hypothetical protein
MLSCASVKPKAGTIGPQWAEPAHMNAEEMLLQDRAPQGCPAMPDTCAVESPDL